MQAVIAVVSLVLTVFSAGSIGGLPEHHADGFSPHHVARGAMPYAGQTPLPRQDTGTVDDVGVRMFRTSDDVLHNHPVAQAQYGIRLLTTWKTTDDDWFLDRAERQAQRLIERRVESRGGWFFPYDFDFNLTTDPAETLHQPWYSDMAQGLALTLFSRLYTATGEARWKEAADATFASMLLPPSDTDPWVTWVDDEGYLWLEEYPRAPESRSENVLNGHMFAAFGVWDYWNITESTDAAALFDAALTTVDRYLPRFRNPGWASSYSLRGLKPHTRYHAVHVGQLLTMHALTSDARFAADAEMLQTDFSPVATRGSVDFAPGRHTGFMFDANGHVTARKAVVLKRASVATADRRGRIRLHGSYWYRITKGAFAGYWVSESTGVRTMRGVQGRIDYVAPRTVTLPAGVSVFFTGGGSRSSMTLLKPGTVRILAMGWMRGQQVVLIGAGTRAGFWTPLTASTVLN